MWWKFYTVLLKFVKLEIAMCKTKKHIKTYLFFCGYVYTIPLSLKRQCSRGRTLFTW